MIWLFFFEDGAKLKTPSEIFPSLSMQLGSAYENTILSVHSALMRHDASYVEVCSTIVPSGRISAVWFSSLLIINRCFGVIGSDQFEILLLTLRKSLIIKSVRHHGSKVKTMWKFPRGLLHGLNLSKFPKCVLGEDIIYIGLNLEANPWFPSKKIFLNNTY